LLQVYLIYVEASFSCCSEHLWQDYPIRKETTGLCVIFAVPPKWHLSANHRKCAIDILLSSCS